MKHVLGIAFIALVLVSTSLSSAGISACKSRCDEKEALCKRPCKGPLEHKCSYACITLRIECKKDCDALGN